MNKVDDKRLSIDIQALRQLIWEDADGEEQDEFHGQLPNIVQWIDTRQHECKRTPSYSETKQLECNTIGGSTGDKAQEAEIPPREETRTSRGGV